MAICFFHSVWPLQFRRNDKVQFSHQNVSTALPILYILSFMLFTVTSTAYEYNFVLALGIRASQTDAKAWSFRKWNLCRLQGY